MTSKEEFANSVIHGIGAVFFLAAAPMLFLTMTDHNSFTSWPLVVFVFCLLMTYISSTVYHAIADPELKKQLRIFDHMSIFLLIGGTFTPVVVYAMGDWNGWPFLSVFWGVMFCGIIFKIFFTGRFKLASTLMYIGVAWCGAMFSGPLIRNIPHGTLVYLIIGGFFYTAGTFFYMLKRMKYRHAIWHFFVMAGSMSHFYAILLLLMEKSTI
jgi:hemolysin III